MRDMKDSGIEWIGEIPNSWETMRLQHCLQEINVSNKPVQTEQVLSLVKDVGVMLYEEKGNVGNKAKEDVSQYKLAYPNTLVLNSMNILIGSVGLSPYFGCVSPVYYVFKENEKTDLRFVNYLFSTRELQRELRKYANGILEIRLRVSTYDLFKRRIPFPTKREQRRIADYLDERCAAIDEVRRTIEDEIEALQRLRKATIHRAVTKGLDEGVAMRDSGMFWATVIRSDWRSCRVKDVVHIGHGSDPKLEGDVPVWGSGEQPFKTCGEKKLGPAVLLGRKGTLNNPQYVDGLYWNVDTAFDAKPLNRRMILRFFFYVASSIDVEILSTNTAKPSMTQSDWGNISIPLPPISEQQCIADYLDKRCATIDSVIDTRTKQLERLEDYRRALIFAYVTGKKEVPFHE